MKRKLKQREQSESSSDLILPQASIKSPVTITSRTTNANNFTARFSPNDSEILFTSPSESIKKS